MIKKIKKLLGPRDPFECKGYGKNLEKIVFEKLPEDIQKLYEDKPYEKAILQKHGYVCKPCDNYVMIA